jgi:hypothetical protein
MWRFCSHVDCLRFKPAWVPFRGPVQLDTTMHARIIPSVLKSWRKNGIGARQDKHSGKAS